MEENARPVVVLGAGGFIGSHLCEALVRRGYDTIGFGRGGNPNPIGGLRWIQGDFNDPGQVRAALAGCGTVFDLVGSSSPAASNADPAGDLSDTVLARVRLLEALRHDPPQRVIHLSSGGAVYGAPLETPVAETAPTEPLCAYGVSKLMVEKYLALYRHLHGLDYLVLRVSNVFGPRQQVRRQQGVVAAFMQAAVAGRPLEIWGDGSVIRDYIHVDDVVEALVCCLSHPGSGHRTYNIGSSVGRSVLDVARSIAALAGRPLDIRHLPGRPADVPRIVLDTTCAARMLGWLPRVSWESGLARTFDWYRGDAEAGDPVGGQAGPSTTGRSTPTNRFDDANGG